MNRYFKFALLLFTSVFILSACSQSQSRSKPQSHSQQSSSYQQKQAKFQQTGIASFYANKYQGRQTANGERFNQNALTAAHKTLKFGTWVKVTNLHNGKQVIVRVNDRGPFVKGRVIDLSASAFSKIADTRAGLVDVGLEILP